MGRVAVCLPVCAVLLLSGAPASGQEAGFEATLSGAVETTLHSDDATWRRQDHVPRQSMPRGLRIDLDDASDHGCLITFSVNVGDSAAGDEEGEYELGNQLKDGVEASKAAITCDELDVGGIPMLTSHSGTLTIESADEERISGSFDLVFVRSREAMADAPESPVRIEGTFDAVYSEF